MVDFKLLETFVWVANLGSFHGAATKLHTTQPAISQRIAQLEAEFGVRLLERDSRSVNPTEKGRELLAHAERLLRMRGEMRLAMGEKNAVRGILRLGVAETIVNLWLPRLIQRVDQDYPHLTLEIDVDISPNLRDRLVAQEIDLAFLLGPVSAPSIHNQPLCQFPMGFLSSPALELPPPPVPLAVLAHHPIITFSRRTMPYIMVRQLFSGPDLPPLRLHASASLAPVVRMAALGIGIAAIPPVIAREEIASGKLVVVETPIVMSPLTFTASWPVTPDGIAASSVARIAAEVAAEDMKNAVS